MRRTYGKMRINTRLKKTDSWIERAELSIGRRINSDGGLGQYVHIQMPMISGKPISDSLLILGRTGSGKSVAKRLIYWGFSKVRPVWIFDYPGRDHYLSYMPNTNMRDKLPPGIHPEGLKGNYYYYAMPYARFIRDWEINIRPNFTKYTKRQLERLGFNPAAARYLKNVMVKFGPFKSMDTLFEFMEHYPCNAYDFKKASKLNLQHKKEYIDNSFISAQSKSPLIDTLYELKNLDIFNTDNSKEINWEKLYLSRRHAVFSYNSEFLGKAEIDYAFDMIQKLRNKYLVDGPRPFVFIEEAHNVFDEGISRFITVCRKLSVGICMTCPKIPDEMPKDVLGDIKNIICGKLKGSTYQDVAALISDTRARGIQTLKSNMYTGQREMLYFNGHYDYIFSPLLMFACPQEMHREV